MERHSLRSVPPTSSNLASRERAVDGDRVGAQRLRLHALGLAPGELTLVCGDSGIGKTSVVNELHKVLVPPRGLFASGKFDQLKRDVPYATVAQAFQGLMQRGVLDAG